jgi:hypothetical protein
MDLTPVITNTNNWNVGFQQLSTWPYATPASYYFWAGFTLVFAFGILGLAYGWIRGIVGGGGAQ